PELFVIAQDLREMQVETSIDESEVGRIRVGQQATFTVDSFPGRTFRGKVSQIRKAAQIVQNVVTYIAVIRTSNPDLNLFPGMTANVRVIIETREDVLKVPNAALRFRPVAYTEAPAASRSDGASAEGDDKGKGAKGTTAQIDRLSKELQLTPGQRTKVESILADTRVKSGDARTDERRRQAEHARSESRTRIAEVLNAEQRARYEAMGGGVRARSGYTTSGRVWVPDTEIENPKAVTVRIGLTDGTYTELVSGGLHEGADVIIGVAPDASKSRPSQQQQKGGPRFGF
ncbi:MAG TPA: efflux RND transporter periplasmic adaptor subunit, partial [Burkholderiales bacterium]|nr:efflux RND transporter periplasmic adaptor subunit [Burkholderiales bacterium]